MHRLSTAATLTVRVAKLLFVVAFVIAMCTVALGVGASLHQYRHGFGLP